MPQFVFPNIRPLTKALTVVNRAAYELSRGRIGGRFSGAPIMLLITTGHKSGKERKTPLLYIEDGGSYVVAATNFGHDLHPGWYLNLRANPKVEVQLGKERRAVTAETASPEEKERLWPRFVEMYAGYDQYLKRTDRNIPVVVLRPEEEA